MYRTFLFTVLALLMGSSVPAQRQETTLDGPWKFAADSLDKGENGRWFVNGLPEASITVRVPHTWNTLPGLEAYWGKGWYEKTMDIPAELKGKVFRLQFDAVYHDATVWVNGRKAGGHYGVGYTRFFIDITELVKPGKPNKIVVLADNSASRNSIPFLKSFDWAHDGGLIRSVKLLITDPCYFERVDVTAIPDPAKPGKGLIRLNMVIPGKLKFDSKTFITAEIREENQETSNLVYSGKLLLKEGKKLESEISTDKIRFWNFDHPNLYSLILKIKRGGITTDTCTTVFGFRSIAVEGERIVLNREAVRLAGIEWMPGSSLKNGMAETREELSANLRLMKGMNCIYTRFHWPQDDFVLDWCDRNGILVQEEIPYWGWATEMNDTTLSIGYHYLDDMIAAHYNHPSLISWGTGNELRAHDPLFIRSLNSLRGYARSKDSTRLVNYVSNSLSWQKSDNPGLLPDASSNGDVLCWNEYTPTWYGLPIEKTLSMLESVHSDYPGKPLVISEFGLCEPVFPGGDERRIQDVQYQIPTYGSMPFISGFIYFCLNDYRTHMGEDHSYAYPQRVHGIVDIHLHKKPSYEVLKNLCSPLELKSVKFSGTELTVRLRGKTGIPSYFVSGYSLDAGGPAATIPDLKPGEEVSVTVPVGPALRKFSIHRPGGFSVLEMEF